MPTPTRNALLRHHQQSRTGTLRLAHVQIFGAFALALGVIALMARMHPYQGQSSTERARPERTWSPINGDQLLSLLGMATQAPEPGGKEIHEAMYQNTDVPVSEHQHKDVTIDVSANEDEAEDGLKPVLISSPPDQGQSWALGEENGVWNSPEQSLAPGKDKADAKISEMDKLVDELQKVLEDPQGDVPRLNTTVDEPFGPNDRDHNPLCSAFSNSKTIALVGNGPLDQAQRTEIDASDIVVRFNLMNNWRRFQEKVDVWVIRYSTEASLSYWGVTNMQLAEATNVVKLMKAMWLVGGRQENADGLVKKVPAVEKAHPVLMPNEALAAAYNRQMNVTGGYPSTGFVGLQGVLHCAPPDAVLHLFGFNWHNNTWKAHKMDLEKAFVENLASEGRMVVHETTCYGVRECGGSSTFDQSCHWNGAGRYVCLRGKPRKWTDLTETLGSGRLEQFRGQEAAMKPPAGSGATALLQ